MKHLVLTVALFATPALAQSPPAAPPPGTAEQTMIIEMRGALTALEQQFAQAQAKLAEVQKELDYDKAWIAGDIAKAAPEK